MAMRFMDNFTFYTTSDIAVRYSSQSGGSLSAGNGRFPGFDALRFTATGHVEKILDAQATWIIQFGLKVGSIGSEIVLVEIKDGTTVHVDLRLTAAGALQVKRGDGTSLGSGGTINANTWYAIGLKVTIDNSSGVAVVKQDTVSVINLSSQDTRNGGNATADRIRLKADASITVDFSDLMIMDGSGSVNDDFRNNGDARVNMITVTGAGNEADFTPQSGANYENVDETEADGDTTYNSSSNVTDRDSFAASNLSGSGAVYGVAVVAEARKTDAGARSLQVGLRIGGSYYDSADIPLTSSYQFVEKIWDASPATASAFTASELNGAELQYELSA